MCNICIFTKRIIAIYFVSVSFELFFVQVIITFIFAA